MVNRIGAALGAALLLFAANAGQADAPPAHPHPTSRFVADHPELASQRLRIAHGIGATLRGPDVHRYTVTLRRGQFAAVRIDQVGGNVVGVLFDPSGKLVDIVDHSGMGQAEVLTMIAERDGDYAIQVAVFEWDTPSAAYRIALTRRERAGRTPTTRAKQLFDSWYPNDGAGAALLVLRDDKVLLKRMRGYADVARRTRVRASTAFDLASVSKQFTAYAVALLIERGVLRPGDSVRRYLPELPDAAGAITLQQLLEHTSGVRDWDGLFALTGRRIEDGIDMDAVLAMVVRQQALLFAPGTQQSYSNTGYVLLAHVVERATGQRFDRWLRENVLGPLRLRHCALARTHDADDDVAMTSYSAHSPQPMVASQARMTTLGSSALSCSLDDMRRWLANDVREPLGGEAVRGLVGEPRADDGEPPNDYVFGRWHAQRHGHRYIGHQGLAAGFRTSVRRYPDDGLALVFLSNDGNDAAYQRIDVLEDLFLGVPSAAVEAPTDNYDPPVVAAPSSAAAVLNCLGAYRTDELPARFDVLLDEVGRLSVRLNATTTLALQQVGQDEFASSAWYLPRLRFDRDAAGKVESFTILSEDVGAMRVAKLP